jgi:hypothetical protein
MPPVPRILICGFYPAHPEERPKGASQDGAAPWFETRRCATLLTMRLCGSITARAPSQGMRAKDQIFGSASSRTIQFSNPDFAAG